MLQQQSILEARKLKSSQSQQQKPQKSQTISNANRWLSDNELMELITDLGNCFVLDNAYRLQPENYEVALEIARHFMGAGNHKGYILQGTNGTGKTLFFRIMQIIAPWFEREFDWLNATRRMNALKQRKPFIVEDWLNDRLILERSLIPIDSHLRTF